MMRLKTGFALLYCLVFCTLFTACLGDGDDNSTIVIADDAEILSFSLSHDSIPALKTTVFSIDQINGVIFNRDSLVFGTQMRDTLLIAYTNGTSVANVFRIDGQKDTIWITSGDKIPVAQLSPLQVMSLDRKNIKEYTVHLNVHQVDPDSMQYKQIASNLSFLNVAETKTLRYEDSYYTFSKTAANEIEAHRSADFQTWETVTMTGEPNDLVIAGIQSCSFDSEEYLCATNVLGDLYVTSLSKDFIWEKVESDYPVKKVLGFLDKSSVHESGLAVIIDKEGQYYFAFTHDLQEWKEGESVDADFPSDFSATQNNAKYLPRITLAGVSATKGVVWTTEDGLYWVKLTDRLPKLEGANICEYAGELYIFNGRVGDIYNNQVYYSIDGGVTWQTKESKAMPPKDYPLRRNASLVVDAQGSAFYFVGGQNDAILTNVWKGFLNKQLFLIRN
ncbi:MAG: DUF6242 domain-containing protein [Dysgonamonadaceae bacterium]|jgi:hypothetical protein|nr:DUF6242 domain-containing protein [Dysgonamonadaceae bacterium]